MDNTFEKDVLNKLDNIENLMRFKCKDVNDLLVKQNPKFYIKTDKIGKIFSDMFYKCDTEEQSLWVKKKLLEIVENQYNEYKEMQDIFK